MMLSQTPRTALLPTLTAISALGMVASTIYVPSVIEIADALGTSVARVQLTFVGYLAAFALGMLVLGPLSDHYGRRRTLVFGATEPQNNISGHWQEYAFTMDGKIFDPARIDQRVRLGAVEEWTIRNTHKHDDHMFHIHTNPFQVIEIGGQPQADRTWRDTVVVPRPAAGGSTVIRTRFLDYTGVFMMHCHMMNHEELGMMQSVEVYDDANGPIGFDAGAICRAPRTK